MTKKNKTDVAIVATAVKIHFWKDFYAKLCLNESKIHLIFVGNQEPKFKLPDNFTFIYSDLKPAACAEIAYRYSYENIDSRFILHTADDLVFEPNYIDALVEQYSIKKQEYKDRDIMITPRSRHQSGNYDLMAPHNGGPLLGTAPFTTTENNKKIGGIDKRFYSVCWDMDRVYRFYQMGGIMIPLLEKECPAICERPQGAGLWGQYANHDLNVLKEYWGPILEDQIDGIEIFSSSMVGGENKTTKKKFVFSRRESPLQYNNEELE